MGVIFSANALSTISRRRFIDLLESGKIPQIGTIVHLGACASQFLTDARYFLKIITNIPNVLRFGIGAQGAIYICFIRGYLWGRKEAGYDTAEATLNDLRPLNIYGYSKHLFDLWLLRNGLLSKVTGFNFSMSLVPTNTIKAK
jgi:ADP-L-glycero-D-manno-heptose 6-epimerase